MADVTSLRAGQDRGPRDLWEVCACPTGAPALGVTCSCICTEQRPCEPELTLFSFRELNHRLSSKPRTEVQQSSDFCSAKTQAALKPHVAERWPARPDADQGARPWARGGFCSVQACHPGCSLSPGLPAACRGPPARTESVRHTDAPSDRMWPPAPGLLPRWHSVVASSFRYQAIKTSPAEDAGQWTRLKKYLLESRGL